MPLYNEGHDLICALSDFFIQDASVCYELGSATGMLLRKLAQRHARTGAQFIGIESVPEMIVQAREECGKLLPNLRFVEDDISLYPYERSDLHRFVLSPSSSFAALSAASALRSTLREPQLGGCAADLRKGQGAGREFQDYMTALYTDFKLEQGYSPDEIIAKARSLKRVQEPFSTKGYLDLFGRAGFVDVMSVIKWVCFEGFLAIK